MDFSRLSAINPDVMSRIVAALIGDQQQSQMQITTPPIQFDQGALLQLLEQAIGKAPPTSATAAGATGTKTGMNLQPVTGAGSQPIINTVEGMPSAPARTAQGIVRGSTGGR